MKKSFSFFLVLILCFTNACGLFFAGTESGRDLLGLEEDTKKLTPESILALLGVPPLLPEGYPLVFNPSPLTVALGGSYTVSFREVPSSWADSGLSIDVEVIDLGCSADATLTGITTAIQFNPEATPNYSNAHVTLSVETFPESADSEVCILEHRAANISSPNFFAVGQILGYQQIIVLPMQALQTPN